MANTLAILVSACLCALVQSQESNFNSTSASPPVPPNVTSHGDVQILYTDELIKVIEKYGITNDDIMVVTNKYKEGNAPTVMKMMKNEDTGKEEMVEVNLKNFIAGGHMTDLTPILESPEPPMNSTSQNEAPEAVTTREDILANLRKRERDLLMNLERNRQEYEQIAQALMEVRKEIVMNTPDEYDMMSSGTIRLGMSPERDDRTPDPAVLRALFRRAQRQALIRYLVRRNIMRRRSAALTGFPPNPSRSSFQPARTLLIPVRRSGIPFFLRVNRRPRLTIRAPTADGTQGLTEPRQLPVVVDERNTEIQTKPFEPVPRVTELVSTSAGDNEDVSPSGVP